MAETTDAQLVASFLDGDQASFAAIYDRYADRIYSYCLTMLRSSDDAADAAQDTFVKAATRMGQLENHDKLRPWLFSIARNEAHGEGRRRARVTPEDDLTEVLVEEPDLAMGVKQDELRELVWAAAAGLGERDRDLMSFHLVEGLEGDDLAEAMGVETSHVHVLVSRMKNRVEKAMGALLIARLGSDDCEELGQLLADWDGTFDTAVRSKVNRHIESCEVCEERRGFLLAPANVLPGILVVPAPAALRDRVLGAVAPKTAATAGLLQKEWVKMAGFAIVALVVGLIGLGVSARFDPLETPATVPAAAPPSTAAIGAVTTTTVVATTSTSVPTATTTTAVPTDAALELDQTEINFGANDTERSVEVTNTGGLPADWEATSAAVGIALSPSSGTLGAGESATIVVTLDRSEAAEGDLIESIDVTWQGGALTVSVVGSNNANPILHNPQASPSTLRVNAGTFCNPTQAAVTVRVRDASPLDRVVVRWAGQETPMIDIGNEMWEGVIGPFTVAQQETVRMVAFDIHGNAGGAAITVDVTPCP